MMSITKMDISQFKDGRVLASQAQNHVPRKKEPFELPNILDLVTLHWLAYKVSHKGR